MAATNFVNAVTLSDAGWFNDVDAATYDYVINVKNSAFGAVGDGVTDDLAAFNLAFATLSASTDAAHNRAIYVPQGTYVLSTTPTIANSASNFTIFGDGKLSSILKWSGAAGVPMLKFINAQGVILKDLGIYGKTTAKPSYLVNFHRQASLVGGTGASMCKIIRCMLGEGNGDHTTGVSYTCIAGQDTNNEQGYFEDVLIYGSASYGYHFAHSNSLLHKIVGGAVAYYGTAAICNEALICDAADGKAGSFKCWSTTFAGNTGSVVFRLYAPRHAIGITDCTHENGAATNTALLATPTSWATGTLNFFGGSYKMTTGAQATVQFDGTQYATLNFHGTNIGDVSTFSFPTIGPRVAFFGGGYSTASVTYNCEVAFYDVEEGTGSVTYTNSGTGILRLIRSGGTGQRNTVTNQTGNLTSFSVDAQSSEVIYLTNASATNLDTLTKGHLGQKVTFIGGNGNTTLVHTAAVTSDMLRLHNNVNYTLPTGGSITLIRADTGMWFEIGRKV